ncbi:DUF4926 domain-containing protein [Pedobacter sp. ASV12]|uniref:DUF4926 domain-containing protein n=1 Tax=Pedobacter sp. ASV12 TaxID=2795120 RepID=UPI0018EB72C3|nr:DUF4926 domain-containing protein [Pedobacter sp. ASV12]
MIKKYDIVKAIKTLNDKVFEGCKGTVLIIYPDFPLAFEVEFVDEMNETLDVLTVKADDIVKME